ncbi:MAG: hypothetical protein KC419_03690 [Anaerolineales bacterium]|nr:hypothetical protein [Anaerolineales bacterium]
MSQIDQSQGLTCPNCSGVVPIPEGARIVQCPFCEMQSIVQGERGIRRWQVARQVERLQALEKVNGFFSGMKKARDLKQEAQIKEMFLIYLPYWRVQAIVAGWMFGRVKSGKDSTRPIEVEVLEEMHWNDAAVDVSEYGVHRVSISKNQLQPYDGDRLYAEAMVFDPSESRTDALAEAEQHFIYRARKKRSLRTKFFEKFHLLRQRLSLVYYPLWVARYEYKKRNYQVVVDGVNGEVLYGKAPGNILYRAAALVLGMALGNLMLVDGTALAVVLASTSDDGDGGWLVLLPIAIGIGLIISGYRAFRYGEEVEEIDRKNKKASMASDPKKRLESLLSGSGDVEALMSGGLNFLEEIGRLKD